MVKDCLNLITLKPSLIYGYTNAVLTPNINEYKRLCQSLKITSEEDLPSVCSKLGGVVVLRKGQIDCISDGSTTISCDITGSPRRCGGQGDVLAGSLGTMLAWGNLYRSKCNNILPEVSLTIAAAYTASLLVRECSKEAFSKHFRSTTTPDIIAEIGTVFHRLFPCES